MTDRRIVSSKECVESVIALVIARWPWLTREILLDTANRSKPVTLARWVTWKLLRNCGVSLPQIQRHTGVDHTSVMYGLRGLAKIEAQNANFAAEIAALEAEITVTTAVPAREGTSSAQSHAIALLTAGRDP